MTIRKRAKGRSTKFRSEALREKPQRVDREAKVIVGYSVMRIGEAKGHGVEIDSETIDQCVELGQAAGDRGLKSRFTHPNMSSDGMGSFLGRSKNFRRDGDRVRADLHFSPRAFDSPRGDLGTYTLNLADSDPDVFGSSVVITYRHAYRLNEDGTRQRDEDGNPLPPLVRLEKLHACDIVDDPAANEGLFSSPFDDALPDFPARAATAVLDRLFGSDSPDVVRERVDDFLNRYFSNREEDSMVTGKDKNNPTPPAIDPRVKAALLGIKLIPTADASDEICAAVLSSFFTLREQDQPSGVDELVAALQAKPENQDPSERKPPKEESRDELSAARLAEKKRVTEITALCAEAGFPDRADRYIDKDFSVEQVRQELWSAVCKRNTPVGDDGGTGGEGKPEDPDAKYKAEYKAEQAVYQRAGLSEADYVASRRIDDGLDQLTTAKA